MKLKLTGDVVANWIQSTMDEIKELLRKYEIPFVESWSKGDQQVGRGRRSSACISVVRRGRCRRNAAFF